MTSRSAAAAESLSTTKDPVVLDRTRLRDLTEGDVEFERELLETFAVSVRNLLGELRANLLARNAVAVAQDAHSLKGASLNVGAISIARWAAALEMTARAGHIEPIDVTLDELRNEEQALWAELARY
jgi:HPt (histidine-containing phosphotransfer) domain-containing protein